MKFHLYRKHGALNSPPIFNAFENGIKVSGHMISNDENSIPVIWSVLWNGRMAPNEKIYRHAIKNNLPIIIIEVGNLKRGITWRISCNHINRLGYFGNQDNLDFDRPKNLGIFLKPL